MTYLLYIDEIDLEVEITFRIATDERENCEPFPYLTEFEWNKRFYTETQNVVIENEIERQKDDILEEILIYSKYSI